MQAQIGWRPIAKLALLARRGMTDYRNGTGGIGQSQATRLLRLLTDVEVFQTPDGRAHVTIVVQGHRETCAVGSAYFRNWLAGRFYGSEMEAPNHWALEEAIVMINAKAQFDGKVFPVFTRVAESDGDIYLDLGDSTWRAAKITPSGWTIDSNPAVRFRRSNGMLAFPTPVPGGHINDLRRFVNVTDDDWIL